MLSNPWLPRILPRIFRPNQGGHWQSQLSPSPPNSQRTSLTGIAGLRLRLPLPSNHCDGFARPGCFKMRRMALDYGNRSTNRATMAVSHGSNNCSHQQDAELGFNLCGWDWCAGMRRLSPAPAIQNVSLEPFAFACDEMCLLSPL